MRNIVENNKLICDYMGYEFVGKNSYIVNVGVGTEVRTELLPTQYMKFDKSWDWLMPVVKRISDTIGYKSVDECSVEEWCASIGVTRLTITARIGSVYNAVLDFIEWYNTKK